MANDSPPSATRGGQPWEISSASRKGRMQRTPPIGIRNQQEAHVRMLFWLGDQTQDGRGRAIADECGHRHPQYRRKI